jgi:hypothetical protein
MRSDPVDVGQKAGSGIVLAKTIHVRLLHRNTSPCFD